MIDLAPPNRRTRRALRAVLATNYSPVEIETIILPALREQGVEVLATIPCEPGQNFNVVARERPDVVLAMTEVMSHSASAKLANKCRELGTPMRSIGRSKSGWIDTLDQLRAKLLANEAPSFPAMLKQEREGMGYSHRDISVHVGVMQSVVRAWELGEAEPTRQEMKRLCGSLRRLRPFLAMNLAEEQGAPEEAPEPASEPELAPVLAEPVPPPQSFEEALRRARLAEGLSQDEVAELLEVRRSAVSQWETGETVPILAHYDKLCAVFEELVFAPKPPSRDQEKPVGNPSGCSPPPSRPRAPAPEEAPPMSQNERARTLEAELRRERELRAAAENALHAEFTRRTDAETETSVLRARPPDELRRSDRHASEVCRRWLHDRGRGSREVARTTAIGGLIR